MSKVLKNYTKDFRVPASFVILLRNQQFFMVRRANTNYMAGKLGLPSGHVEPDETFLEAAAREVKEETGLTVDLSKLKQVHLCDRFGLDDIRIWTDVYFLCADFEGEPVNAELHKASEAGWFDYQNPPEDQMVPELAQVLTEIKAGNSYSVFPRR